MSHSAAIGVYSRLKQDSFPGDFSDAEACGPSPDSLILIS